MARDETDDVLPDKDVAKEFYAKYEPKEILGRYVDHILLCKKKNTLLFTHLSTFSALNKKSTFFGNL